MGEIQGKRHGSYMFLGRALKNNLLLQDLSINARRVRNCETEAATASLFCEEEVDACFKRQGT